MVGIVPIAHFEQTNCLFYFGHMYFKNMCKRISKSICKLSYWLSIKLQDINCSVWSKEIIFMESTEPKLVDDIINSVLSLFFNVIFRFILIEYYNARKQCRSPGLKVEIPRIGRTRATKSTSGHYPEHRNHLKK